MFRLWAGKSSRNNGRLLARALSGMAFVRLRLKRFARYAPRIGGLIVCANRVLFLLLISKSNQRVLISHRQCAKTSLRVRPHAIQLSMSTCLLFVHIHFRYFLTSAYNLLMNRRLANRRTRWGRMYLEKT